MDKHVEKERKFIYKKSEKTPWSESLWVTNWLEQYYVNGDKSNHCRIRFYSGKGAELTWKLKKQDYSKEVNTKIDYDIFYNDISSSGYPSVKKNRYSVKDGHQKISIDFFEGGLVLVEIEHASLDQEWIIPDFCGAEVTHRAEVDNYTIATKFKGEQTMPLVTVDNIAVWPGDVFYMLECKPNTNIFSGEILTLRDIENITPEHCFRFRGNASKKLSETSGNQLLGDHVL